MEGSKLSVSSQEGMKGAFPMEAFLEFPTLSQVLPHLMA
jgi:hypothetical protein